MTDKPSFFAELKRRNVLRAATFYAASAWLLVQIATQVFPFFHVDDWIVRWIVIAAVIGFPFAMLFSWFYEWTPHGIERESEVEADASVSHETGKKLERWTIAILGMVVVLLLTDRFVLHKDANTETAPLAPGKSIAVLPFIDLSPAHDQGYFSDGMSEEILNALAQVKDLKVAGRTSSFYYKGRNEDLRTVGKALGVANILEGSVRKQGNKVRITAQLIQVSDDTHLWSHDYDGDLSDVFQLQDNIARAITDQLKVVLTVDQKAHLVQVGTTNTDAYNLYLQATDALNHRDYKRMGDAIGWLGQAIELDPNFAQAHSRLAMIHALGWTQYGASESEAQRQAQIALALDPKLAETQYALAFLARKQRRLLDAREAIERAIVLAPNDASANFYYAQQLINTGYTLQGIVRLDRALAIDPMLPNALHWRALQYLFANDADTAERLWKRAGAVGLSYADVGLAAVAQARGDFMQARSLSIPNLLANPNGTACLKAPQTSVPAYFNGVYGGDLQARGKALAVVNECLAAKPTKVPLWAAQGLHHLDKPERALQVIAQGPTTDDAGLFNFLWSPQWSDVRRLPEFAGFARKVGFAAVWDRYGPPDTCQRKGRGDYVCE
jgi:TolB-like protein